VRDMKGRSWTSDSWAPWRSRRSAWAAWA
jgi:hypothetical protein